MIHDFERLEYLSTSNVELLKPRLVAAVDRVPELRNIGIVHRDPRGHSSLIRTSQYPQVLQTVLVLEELLSSAPETPVSKVWSELGGLGISFGGMAATVVGLGAGAASAPLWVAVGAVAAAASLGIATGRTINAFFIPENNEILNASDVYQGINSTLDLISLASAGVGLKAIGSFQSAKAYFAAVPKTGTDAQKTEAVKKFIKSLSQAERNEFGREMERLIAKGAIQGDRRKLQSAVNMITKSGGQVHHLLKIDGSTPAAKVLQREVHKQLAGVFGNTLAPVGSAMPASVAGSASGNINKLGQVATAAAKRAVPQVKPLGDFEFQVPLKGKTRLRWWLYQQQPRVA